MKYLKPYQSYLESLMIDVSIINIDINESLGLYYENILNSIGAEEVDMFDTFSLPKDEFADKLNLDLLTANTNFINSLSSIGLKKSNVQNTDDLETFVNKPCRFMLIYNIESNELENPIYMIFQSWNETIEKWADCKLYKVNNIQKFYDKLSSKVIEIDDSGEKYIYQSSNKNEWALQNIEKVSDKFKKYFRKEDFEKFINDNKFKINII
jgi:predicted transcriptional regulator